ncbi:DUF2516 family protein [Sphaerisporangium dianthi]|uniref:DUF2516 family protein n=1 Tax=Sphaerisporangium dianthi TaxID=1436120 RepID=A0ABV9CC96_9ACTN
MFEIHSFLDLIFFVLAVAAFGMCAWALFHAIRTPARAFAMAQKLSKKLWLLFLSLATLFTFAAVVGYAGLTAISFFTIISVVASGVYLADVKPAVGEIGRGGRGGNNGPYGPW